MNIETTQYETKHTRTVTNIKHCFIAMLAGVVLVILFTWACAPYGGA